MGNSNLWHFPSWNGAEFLQLQKDLIQTQKIASECHLQCGRSLPGYQGERRNHKSISQILLHQQPHTPTDFLGTKVSFRQVKDLSLHPSMDSFSVSVFAAAQAGVSWFITITTTAWKMECGAIKRRRQEERANREGESFCFSTQISLLIPSQGERVKYCLWGVWKLLHYPKDCLDLSTALKHRQIMMKLTTRHFSSTRKPSCAI